MRTGKATSMLAACAALAFAGAAAEESGASPQPAAAGASGPVCGGDARPYRDFDFLVGSWDFFTMDDRKIGEQVYTKREQGCLIVEDWTTLNGGTGMGVNFVDPATGLWRQVWMSPRFHIDYSGGLDENGDILLEGRIYPNDGSADAPVRGVYARQDDGSVVKEFLQFNEETNVWERFFIGRARRIDD